MLSWRTWLLRFMAAFLLFSAGVDFCAFDTVDPSAPMSEAQPMAFAKGHCALNPSELPDDCCLCCGTALPQSALAMLPVFLADFHFIEPPQQLPDWDIPAAKRPPRA